MKTKQEFRNFFEGLKKPETEKLVEGYTHKVKIALKIILPITLILLAIAIISLIEKFSDNSSAYNAVPTFIINIVVIMILLATIFTIIGTNASFSKKIETHIKNTYNKEIITFLLEDEKFSYSPESYIPQQTFKNSKLYREVFDDFNGEDLLIIDIKAKRGDNYAKLKTSDLNVTETHTDSEGNRKTYTIFRGVFFEIEFKKSFKCQFSINTKIDSSLKNINLEGLEFEKNFKVYADDQIETRMILTLTFMKRLLDLKEIFKKSFKMSLKENKIYIGVPSRNLFNISKTKNFSFETVEQLYDDLYAIKSIIEELQKNRKVFHL